MSKAKKGRKLTRAFGDITLNDFANSTVCKDRPRKSSKNVTHVIKKLEEDKLWDEKIDEFDGEFVKTVDEDGNVKYVLENIETKKRKGRTVIKYGSYKGGKDYPLDIWFLISEYIRPEDVGKFASICKTSFAVTHTAKFWFNLYKRYYVNVCNLPARLQPESMLRRYGIRCSVVRALHYMYIPYALKSTKTFEKHPDSLNKQLCILMWFHKFHNAWYYCFKLKDNNGTLLPRNSDSNKLDLIEMLEDVSANSEENCRILEVICSQFTAIPTVQGLTLNSAIMTLSSTFRHHKLQMVFNSGAIYVSHKISGSSTTSVVLDHVIHVRILDWWHPLYPHNNNIEQLMRND